MRNADRKIRVSLAIGALEIGENPFPRKPPDSPSMLLTGNTQGRNSQGRRDMRWIFQGRMEDRPAATAAFIASKIFNGSRFLRSEEPTVRPKCLGIFEDHPGLRSFVCRQTADPAQVRQPQGVSSVIFRESQMGVAFTPSGLDHQTREPLSIRASAMRMQAPIKPAMR